MNYSKIEGMQMVGMAYKNIGGKTQICIKFFLIDSENKRRFRYIPINTILKYASFPEKNFSEATKNSSYRAMSMYLGFLFHSDSHRIEFYKYLGEQFQKKEVAMMNLKK